MTSPTTHNSIPSRPASKPLRWGKVLFLALISLIAWLVKSVWHALLFLIDLIDGGEDNGTIDKDAKMGTSLYNYRTGEVDPIRRPDGLYRDHP